jgi:hypothetical protein
MNSISKWEYTLVPLATDRDDENVQDALNGVGEQGWELTAVYEREEVPRRVFVFKRPAESK